MLTASVKIAIDNRLRSADAGQRVFPADQFDLISERVRQLTVELVNDHFCGLTFFSQIAWRSKKYFDEPSCSCHYPLHLFDNVGMHRPIAADTGAPDYCAKPAIDLGNWRNLGYY